MGYTIDYSGKANTSDWWNKDMSDAGQGLFTDPQSALNVGTMPKQVLADRFAAEEQARKARGGFMENLMDGFSVLNKGVDGALSSVPGWGVAKDVGGFIGKTAWWPVDKVASGAYWLYSEAVSQPLSTLFLQSARGDYNGKGFWGTMASGDEWAKSYGKAEHLSPGQAFVNAEKTQDIATGESGLFSGIFGADREDFTPQQVDDIKRNSERFLYDTDFWRKKEGWKYTTGTGSLDFIFNVGADPAYLGVSVGSKVVKGARSIKIAGQANEAEGRTVSSASLLSTGVNKIGEAITPAMKTQKEASQATKVNNFFDWTEGKTGAEIAQHPIWGTGRRVNPARDQLSQVLAGTAREDKPLILRFAAGDNIAASELVSKSKDTMAQIAKMEDNRVLVDSARFDNDILQHFIGQEKMGLGGAAARPGVLGTSEGVTPAGQLVEPPFPRPTEPGPRQSGWDKTYGHLAEQSKLYRQAAGGILRDLNGVRPMGGAAGTAAADVLRAQQWKAGQLSTIDTQIAALQEKVPYWGRVLGADLSKGIEDYSPGQSNLFGTVKELYRMGPLALRDTQKAADKGIARMSEGVGDKLKKGDAKFVTRLIRNGFYTPAVRVVHSFGDRVPEKFINHNDEDAYSRVADMLKRVPGLGPETRLGMVNEYVSAGDKVAKSAALDSIQSRVVEHMASTHKLDAQTAAIIDDIRKVGFTKAMTQLTGTAPMSQRFSAAKELGEEGLPTGRMVDVYEDGEAHIITPLAKSQLSMAEPLLPVKELDRILSRNSGYLRALRKGGGTAKDGALSISDSLNTMWKAATLLRPGYVLRSMSEEQVASAVKFGLASSIIGGSKGGANWALNRGQQLKAVVGKGSYASTTNPAKGILRIVGDEELANAEKLKLPTERVYISKAWPLVNQRIIDERAALKGVEDQMKKLKSKPGADQTILDDLATQAAEHQQIIAEHGDYAKALLSAAKDSKGRRLGEGVFEHEGQIVPEAFSEKWEHPIPRDQITSGHAMETVFARGEAIDNGRIIKTGSWTTIHPEDANHMESWLNGINKQFRQDELFRVVAEDPTLRKAQSWLKTPAGKYHISLLGPRARDHQGTLDAIKQTLDQYLPQGTGLQQKLAKGQEIHEHELRGAMAEEDFPTVHGEELRNLTAHGSKQTAQRTVDDIIAKGFEKLATIPNDVMARHPIYLRAQEARMRDLISQEVGYQKSVGAYEGQLSLDRMNAILAKSDKLARKDIAQVVYDPVRTTATEALRFVSPFLSAHMDGLTRWGGLVAERPQFLGTAARIYNAPVAANLITDSNGQHVDQTGYATVTEMDLKTGKDHKVRKFVPLEDRVLTLSMPWDTKNVKGVGAVPKGGVPIKLSALNTILPGDPWFSPGTGPFVQIPASALAKQVPQIGDFLQWTKVLPYGPSETWTDPLLPKYMKDAWAAFVEGDKGNDAYQKAFLSEYQRQMGEYANGGEAPDMKVVAENARSFMKLQAFMSWAMPAQNKATPLTGSPYQFFMDQYKVMQDLDPQHAQDMFMEKYGKDYFAFTASLSKSMGIGATLSADHVATQYGDLIEKNPDLASLIVGDVYNKGEFSSSVYAKQMDQLIAGRSVREKMTAQEAIEENQKDLGWKRYNRYMGKLDAALIRSGFRSYSEAGAEGFTEVKQKLIQMIGMQNESWFKDYGSVQMNKMPITMNAMERIVKDDKLMSDPMRTDLHSLKTYMYLRNKLKTEMSNRGVSKLSFDINGDPTGENDDIGHALKGIQLMLVNNDTRFGDLYHRYLERDDLS